MRNLTVADWRSHASEPRDRLPRPAGRGVGGLDGSRAARGVVRERRRARRTRGRRGSLPLGRRRRTPCNSRGGDTGRTARARLGRRRDRAAHNRGSRGGDAAARPRVHPAVRGGTRAARTGLRLRVTDPTGREFDALSDPHRPFVLEALPSRETDTAPALAAELPVTRKAVAKHLAALNDAVLVESRREVRE